MRVDLSLIVTCRDQEADLPEMVRSALVIAQSAREAGQEAGHLSFEILALDERSRDNSLASLALLQSQIAQLAVYDDIRPGEAIKTGIARSRGKVVVLLDGPVAHAHGIWAVEAVLAQQPAALVPEEILAIRRDLAEHALLRLRGGLVRAQRAIRSDLARRDLTPAYAPASADGLRDRTRRWLRGQASAFPWTARTFDRPA